MASARFVVLVSIATLITFTVAGSSDTKQKEQRSSETRPPNIIVFLADDLGYGDLSSQGHPTIHTPNLDQLALEGLRFTSMYSVSPVCSASRYALLTGKVPGRAGFPWVLYPGSERGIHRDENTLAEVLKTSGYATSIIGKWHLGSSKRQYLPLQNGFDEYFGLPYSNDMIPPHWRPLALFQGNDTLELNPKQHLLPPQFDEKAKQFIRERKDKPFFLFFSFSMPHVPLRPGLAVRGQSLRGRYGDAVEEIDQSVGAVIDVLKEEDLLENTIIWFTSDKWALVKKRNPGRECRVITRWKRQHMGRRCACTRYC